jgi:hypothetical protein
MRIYRKESKFVRWFKYEFCAGFQLLMLGCFPLAMLLSILIWGLFFISLAVYGLIKLVGVL